MLKNKKIIPAVFVPLVAALVLTACSGGGTPFSIATSVADDGTHIVPVALRNFEFEPEEFVFQAGTVVEFRMESKDIEHTFTVKALDIDWSVRAGGEISKTFTFDIPGEYRLICTVLGHEQAGMVGVVRVQ